MSSLGFVMGKSNLTPHPAHTIRRLELCAAVLAVEMADLIEDEIDTDIHSTSQALHRQQNCAGLHQQYTQEILRVCSDVNCIRKSTHPEQWRFTSTEHNPADHGTVPTTVLKYTNWLSGPSFLSSDETKNSPPMETFDLVEPDADRNPTTGGNILHKHN